jgi:hypothetical protein
MIVRHWCTRSFVRNFWWWDFERRSCWNRCSCRCTGCTGIFRIGNENLIFLRNLWGLCRKGWGFCRSNLVLCKEVAVSGCRLKSGNCSSEANTSIRKVGNYQNTVSPNSWNDLKCISPSPSPDNLLPGYYDQNCTLSNWI